MAADAINLDEVVAIGYGIAKKSDLTGAVASIKSENLTNSKVGTVTTALQGLAAGVQVTTGSVKPGGDASVVIRGVGSLRAGSEPLYIVDGIPVQGGLQDLSSGDIESIEILKDASSLRKSRSYSFGIARFGSLRPASRSIHHGLASVVLLMSICS